MSVDPPARPDQVKILGTVLRARREALGVSQEEAAAGAGIDRSHYSNIERGETKPGYTTLVRIADSLSIRLSQIQEAVEAISDGNTR